MESATARTGTFRHLRFVETLGAYSRQHRAQHWQGNFGDFLTTVLPASPVQFARSSHQYIWDMLRWFGQGDDARELSLIHI